MEAMHARDARLGSGLGLRVTSGSIVGEEPIVNVAPHTIVKLSTVVSGRRECTRMRTLRLCISVFALISHTSLLITKQSCVYTFSSSDTLGFNTLHGVAAPGVDIAVACTATVS